MLNDITITKQNISINTSLTSYEIVCATDRNFPNNAYFLFDDHPKNKTGYTFIISII